MMAVHVDDTIVLGNRKDCDDICAALARAFRQESKGAAVHLGLGLGLLFERSRKARAAEIGHFVSCSQLNVGCEYDSPGHLQRWTEPWHVTPMILQRFIGKE